MVPIILYGLVRKSTRKETGSPVFPVLLLIVLVEREKMREKHRELLVP